MNCCLALLLVTMLTDWVIGFEHQILVVVGHRQRFFSNSHTETPKVVSRKKKFQSYQSKRLELWLKELVQHLDGYAHSAIVLSVRLSQLFHRKLQQAQGEHNCSPYFPVLVNLNVKKIHSLTSSA